MAPVDDTELIGVEARRLALVAFGAPAVSVERGLGMLVHRKVEAGVDRVALDDCREVGNLLKLAVIDGAREAIREPGSGQQRAGLIDVAASLGHRVGIVERQIRDDGMVIADPGAAREQQRDHLLAIEREGHGLAHTRIGAAELTLRSVEPHLTVGCCLGL